LRVRGRSANPTHASVRVQGLLLDGYNSCLRYYLNNFVDGERQDAIDLMIGRYKVVPTAPSPFVPRPSQVCFALYYYRTSIISISTGNAIWFPHQNVCTSGGHFRCLRTFYSSEYPRRFHKVTALSSGSHHLLYGFHSLSRDKERIQAW
jgi:hypothetical protein